jgi:phospholipase C
MSYYDGNTVTALWNYAQHFSMSDNFFDTEFGTTVMGHLNLISGQTHETSVATINGKVANGSIIANVEAGFDDCVAAPASTPVQMTSPNVGDLLNAKGVTWGWFYADFPQSASNQPITNCPSTYNSHYDPFQYYKSTSNPHHLPPSSVAAIGTPADQANHNCALTDFWNAAKAGNMPAVSFLKATSAQTGHPANSTPLMEQQFLIETINRLQQLPEWKSMAILITYDDSDGLVRPCDAANRESVERSGARLTAGIYGHVRNSRPRCVPRPLRIRYTASVSGDLALLKAELCEPRGERHHVDPQLHRGQLGSRATGGSVLRFSGGEHPRQFRFHCQTSR